MEIPPRVICVKKQAHTRRSDCRSTTTAPPLRCLRVAPSSRSNRVGLPAASVCLVLHEDIFDKAKAKSVNVDLDRFVAVLNDHRRRALGLGRQPPVAVAASPAETCLPSTPPSSSSFSCRRVSYSSFRILRQFTFHSK